MTAFYHIGVFLAKVMIGGAMWFVVDMWLSRLINWHIVTYPQWSNMPGVRLLIGLVNVMYWLGILIPSIISLLKNTQEPGVKR